MDTVKIFACLCFNYNKSTIDHYIQIEKLQSWYTKSDIFKCNVKLLKNISSTVFEHYPKILIQVQFPVQKRNSSIFK